MSNALAVSTPTSVALARAVSPTDLAGAMVQYKEIQSVIDKALPDCLMKVQGKYFRKKAYWRAVCVAFSLQVEPVSEEYKEIGGDLVWLVTYRATAPNGRSAIGDGTCSMSEKTGAMRTTHNVRAHAHTRAFNRAVSNLVGFGEVSAEELGTDGSVGDEPRFPSINEVRAAGARALKIGWTKEQVRACLEEHEGTFGASGALAGMPEDIRAGVIGILGGRPPAKAETSAPTQPVVVDAEIVDPPAAPAKAPDPVLPNGHRQSWESGGRERFFARLKEIDPLISYDLLCEWCASLSSDRPSALTEEGRTALLTYLAGKGAGVWGKWRAERDAAGGAK